jgi:hypothetical protein
MALGRVIKLTALPLAQRVEFDEFADGGGGEGWGTWHRANTVTQCFGRLRWVWESRFANSTSGRVVGR